MISASVETGPCGNDVGPKQTTAAPKRPPLANPCDLNLLKRPCWLVKSNQHKFSTIQGRALLFQVGVNRLGNIFDLRHPVDDMQRTGLFIKGRNRRRLLAIASSRRRKASALSSERTGFPAAMVCSTRRSIRASSAFSSTRKAR